MATQRSGQQMFSSLARYARAYKSNVFFLSAPYINYDALIRSLELSRAIFLFFISLSTPVCAFVVSVPRALPAKEPLLAPLTRGKIDTCHLVGPSEAIFAQQSAQHY